MSIFNCPYCGSANDFVEDVPIGSRREIVVDCEVCYRPIVVRVKSTSSGLDIEARAENQ